MSNLFYLQELPIDAPFCNRTEELKELRSYAEARANVVLFPRGVMAKHPLSNVFKRAFQIKDPSPSSFIFFGVASVEDVAARLGKAVFLVTHQKEPC